MAPEVGWYAYAILFPAVLPPIRSEDGLLPVRLFTSAGIAALSSPVPLAEFGPEALRRNVCDARWLEQKVRQHEAVVETAMRTGPVLPLKFGTIFLDAEKIGGLIERNASTLRASLEALRDTEEWGVRGFANRPALRARVLQGDPTLRALSDTASAASPGRAFFLKKQTERLAVSHLQEREHALAREAQLAMGKTAVAFTEQQSLLPSSSEEEEVALNLACLVRREEVHGFLAAAIRWNQERAGEGLRLVTSGPWPPYHFVPRLEGDG